MSPPYAGHRLVLTPAVAERLLARAGVPAPWLTVAPTTPTAPAAPTHAVRRLGPLPGPDPHGLGPPDPDHALARLGALVPDPAAQDGSPRLHPRLVAALAPVRSAPVQVRVDLAVAAAGSRPSARLRSWQWAADDTVAALTAVTSGPVETVETVGTQVEVGWHDRSAWPQRLAAIPAAAQDAGRRSTSDPSAAADTDRGVPVQLLVALGAALDARRPDLVDVLTWSCAPGRDPQGLAQLHRCRARLRVLVTGPARAGCLGWVLLPQGWHELVVRDREVRFTPIVPDRLGARVQQLVDGAVR